MINTNKYNILYLDKSHVFAGAEHSLSQLVGNIDKRRFNPTICFEYPQFHQKGYPTDHVQRLFLANGLKWWMGTDRWQHPPRGADCVKRNILGYKLARQVRKNKIDLLHQNLLWTNSYTELLYAKLAGAKIVAHYRTFLPGFQLPKRVIDICDAIICVSDIVKRSVVNNNCAPKFYHVYNPIDFEKYAVNISKIEAKNKLKLPSDKRIISSPHMLQPHKGHDIAIRAFAKFAEEFSDVCLFIAGGTSKKNSQELQRLKFLASELGVEDRVIFSDAQISNVELVYKASEFIYALSVYGEAFGRVAPEAGAAKRIVIATAEGATPEIVKNEKTGILVPAGEVEPVVEWSRKILRNLSAYDKFAKNAQKYVEENFNPQNHALEVQKIYQMVLSK